MEYYKKSMKEGEIWWVFDLDYRKMRFRNYLKYSNIYDLSNLIGIVGKDYKFDIYQRNTVVKILYYIFIERNPKVLLKYWLEIKELVEFNELMKIVENIVLLQNNDLEKLKSI